MRYAKLRGVIRAQYGTQEAFAEAMYMSAATLSCKLTGKTEWTRPEIESACHLLGIPLPEVHTYFFGQ